jgi:hypothetical protein
MSSPSAAVAPTNVVGAGTSDGKNSIGAVNGGDRRGGDIRGGESGAFSYGMPVTPLTAKACALGWIAEKFGGGEDDGRLGGVCDGGGA